MADTVKKQTVKSENNGQPQSFAVLSSCIGENMKNLLSKKEMDCIINGDYENVMAVLGIHRDKGSKEVYIRAYKPNTKSIELLDGNGNSLGLMAKLDKRGFYQINLGVTNTDNFTHKFKITNDKNETYVEEDIYSFPSILGDIDEYLFAEGNHLDLYKKLGAHLMEINGVKGVGFRFGRRTRNGYRLLVHLTTGTAASTLCANITTAAYGISLFRISARANSISMKLKRRKAIF